MLVTEEELLERYLPFDIPVPYNNWQIHAVKIKDFYTVNNAIGILSVDKNTLGDVEFITMSNLRFAMILSGCEEEYIMELERLIRLCLDIPLDKTLRFCMDEDTEYIEVGDSIGQTRDGFPILKDETIVRITPEDFDEIKRLILYSVDIDYTDEYIDPDVRKMTDEYFRLKSSGNNVPLEHKVLCLRIATGMDGEQIGNLSVRQFHLLYSIMVDESDYSANRLAESMGAKFKKPLEHWAISGHKNKYTEAFVDADAFSSYVQSAN